MQRPTHRSATGDSSPTGVPVRAPVVRNVIRRSFRNTIVDRHGATRENKVAAIWMAQEIAARRQADPFRCSNGNSKQSYIQQCKTCHPKRHHANKQRRERWAYWYVYFRPLPAQLEFPNAATVNSLPPTSPSTGIARI